MRTIRNFISALILAISISMVRPVLAHGEEPRLEISVERINPGGVIEVRGVDFESEEAITLMLVNAQTAIPLGDVITDAEGIFLQTVVLPPELAEGTYKFLAIMDDHNITSPDLTVQGSAIISDSEGENGRRDEEEPLLGPVPTYPPGVIPGVAPGAPPEATQTVPATVDRPVVSMPLIGAVTIVIVLGVIILANQRRKSR